MNKVKLLRTAQSELPFLKPVKVAWRYHYARVARKPSDPDFGSLRFIPDSLPGCYVDVGANQGQSIESIRLFKPHARIHAFEANPRLAARLQQRHRDSESVTVHPYGLAGTASNETLFTPVYKGFVYDGLASLDRNNAASWLGPETLYRFSPQRLVLHETACRTERLDDQCLDPIFIKIDVQGYELAVVRGGLETIRRFDPVLMIEDLSHRPKLLALLESLGYQQYLFDDTGFYRADAASAVNFLLMTDRRAATVVLSTAQPQRHSLVAQPQ